MRLIARFVFLTLASSSLWADTYTLEIKGNQSPGAPIHIAVYEASAGQWDEEPLMQLKRTLPEQSSLTIGLTLPTGAYAIRAFVDLDGDGEMAADARGRPREPFASSVGEGRRQPSVHFRRSVFVFDEKRSRTELTLRYPEGTEPGSSAQ